MKIQFTRKQIVSILLIGTMALGFGSLNIQPTAAQFSRSTFVKTARELNLSRSEMRKVAGVMRGFRAEIQDILTPEQYEALKTKRKQQKPHQSPQKLKEELDLTDRQSVQIATARQDMITGLQGILAPNQITKIMEVTGFK